MTRTFVPVPGGRLQVAAEGSPIGMEVPDELAALAVGFLVAPPRWS